MRISALGLFLGTLAAFLTPAQYTSTARLMPPDNQSGTSLAMASSLAASRGDGSFGELATDLLGLKGTSEVFVAILRSRTVQDQIIAQFDLKRVFQVRYMDDARVRLASSVAIAVDRKNQMITISVTDNSPQRAEGIAKAYIDELNRLATELSTSAARRERVFLESRLVQVNQDLESAEKEFSEFSSKTGAIDIKAQGRAMVDAAASLQGQLMFARSELEGIRQIYADSNVRVRDLKARIAELQSQLDKFGGKDPGKTLGPDSDTATIYPSIRKLPLLGVTYADLYRRTKVEEAVYQVLTQQYELAKVREAREIPSVKLLDPPDLPERKSSPRRIVIGVSSMFASLLGGIVFLLGSKIWIEKDPLDPSKAVATEIWVDLKERRFLNPMGHALEDERAVAGSPPRRKRGILSFLGLNSAVHEGNDSRRSSLYVSSEKQFDE